MQCCPPAPDTAAANILVVLPNRPILAVPSNLPACESVEIHRSFGRSRTAFGPGLRASWQVVWPPSDAPDASTLADGALPDRRDCFVRPQDGNAIEGVPQLRCDPPHRSLEPVQQGLMHAAAVAWPAGCVGCSWIRQSARRPLAASWQSGATGRCFRDWRAFLEPSMSNVGWRPIAAAISIHSRRPQGGPDRKSNTAMSRHPWACSRKNVESRQRHHASLRWVVREHRTEILEALLQGHRRSVERFSFWPGVRYRCGASPSKIEVRSLGHLRSGSGFSACTLGSDRQSSAGRRASVSQKRKAQASCGGWPAT